MSTSKVVNAAASSLDLACSAEVTRMITAAAVFMNEQYAEVSKCQTQIAQVLYSCHVKKVLPELGLRALLATMEDPGQMRIVRAVQLICSKVQQNPEEGLKSLAVCGMICFPLVCWEDIEDDMTLDSDDSDSDDSDSDDSDSDDSVHNDDSDVEVVVVPDNTDSENSDSEDWDSDGTVVAQSPLCNPPSRKRNAGLAPLSRSTHKKLRFGKWVGINRGAQLTAPTKN